MTPTFLPLSPKIGGQINNNKPSASQYLTKEQAKHVYKKTESGDIINTEILHQEIEQERQLNRTDDASGDTNPYKELMVNNAEKIEPLLTQMEQWSILSSMLNYVQYNRHTKNYHSLGISMVNKCGKNQCTKEERDTIELDFGPTSDILRKEYLDIYEGIQSEILNTTRFDENSDLSTTYLGKVDRFKNSKIKAEESFPVYHRIYNRKTIKWNRMSNIFRHRSQQILHVKILLYVMQITPFFTQVYIKNTKNSGRKCSIC